MAIGRPTKYSSQMAEVLPDLFAQGQSVVEVCEMLQISKQTFYRWVEGYPAFSDAYKRGLSRSQAWWERLGREAAAGKAKINTATWIFNMKNRFGWRDKQELSGDPKAPVAPAVISIEQYKAARKAMLAEDDC